MKGEEVRIVFADDDLRRLYEDAGFRLVHVGPTLTRSFRKCVGLLAAASNEVELRQFRSLNLKKLKGDRAGQYSIRLDQQWRLILRFATTDDGRAAIIIEIVDYH
jgi:proteic killer suppression protein